MKGPVFLQGILAALGLLPIGAQTKIYIDPGHGGADFGAVNATHGTHEANRVLVTGPGIAAVVGRGYQGQDRGWSLERPDVPQHGYLHSIGFALRGRKLLRRGSFPFSPPERLQSDRQRDGDVLAERHRFRGSTSRFGPGGSPQGVGTGQPGEQNGRLFGPEEFGDAGRSHRNGIHRLHPGSRLLRPRTKSARTTRSI